MYISLACVCCSALYINSEINGKDLSKFTGKETTGKLQGHSIRVLLLCGSTVLEEPWLPHISSLCEVS
jgi:hypothetical protein